LCQTDYIFYLILLTYFNPTGWPLPRTYIKLYRKYITYCDILIKVSGE